MFYLTIVIVVAVVFFGGGGGGGGRFVFFLYNFIASNRPTNYLGLTIIKFIVDRHKER